MSTPSSDTLNTLIYNVRVVDPGQQAIKINPPAADAAFFPDDGTIACSHIELTESGGIQVWTINGSCYTGGIDAHAVRGWTIRDNVIEGFWCASDLSEHAVHLWRGCRDTLVEGNHIRDNARGIGFGLMSDGTARTYADDPCPDASYVGHYGGEIRNNFVFAGSQGLFASDNGFDCGICLASACGAKVFHNTVASVDAPTASSIEWRFPSTTAEIVNNLVTHNLWQRDGATAGLSGNLTFQPLTLFADGAVGDLHLLPTAGVAIDEVAAPAGSETDIDGDARPFGTSSDAGADEYWPGEPVFGSSFEPGDTREWSGSEGSGCAVLESAAYIGSYGLEVTVGSSCSEPDDVVLGSQTVTSPLAVEACASILAGDGFVVAGTGDARFTAGREIVLQSGFSVESGGGFSSVIDSALFPYSHLLDDTPDAETAYQAQFFLDLDDLNLGAGHTLHLYTALSAARIAQLRLLIQSGPELVLEVRDDSGVVHATSSVPLTSGWNKIGLAWEAAVSATATLTVNDGNIAQLADLDTENGRIDEVRLGVVGGDVDGASGTLRIDGFSSWR